MKIFSTIILALTILHTNHAQEYTFAPSSNWVTIEDVHSVTIQGYSGNEVIIKSKHSRHDDKRSQGLKRVDPSGDVDNTDLGLSVKNESGSVVITQVENSKHNNSCGNHSESIYVIKVPVGMNIKYTHSSWEGEKLYIRDISGELDISSNYHDIHLENVTGPMAVKTVYGTIDCDFKALSQNGSVSLYSVYESVDVSIPNSASANVKLSTTYGNIYSDLNIDIDKEKSGKKGYTGAKIVGKTNQGGVDLLVTATYENIYLRSN